MTMSPSYLAIGMGGHFEGFVGCGESQASRLLHNTLMS